MGISYIDLKMLRSAYRAGARFARIVSIGRSQLSLHDSELVRLRTQFEGNNPVDGYQWKDYFEPYFKRMFNADYVASIDSSNYEGASIIHDMNTPIPPALANNFDLVIDGGSLEHIFNFPTAVANLMKLAKVGGYILTINPANNLCGHGFYQFTPELMYRVFSEDNGFVVKEMIFSEHYYLSVDIKPARRFVRVRDPKHLGRRMVIVNKRPLMLRTLAVKMAETPLFAQTPQQSDYVSIWQNNARSYRASQTDHLSMNLLREIYGRLPLSVQSFIAAYRSRYRLSNKAMFEPYV